MRSIKKCFFALEKLEIKKEEVTAFIDVIVWNELNWNYNSKILKIKNKQIEKGEFLQKAGNAFN